MGLKTIHLADPIVGEKFELLKAYMEEWRRIYSISASLAIRIDRTRTRQARLWYRAHQFRCDHTPVCKTIGDYWEAYRRPILFDIKRRLAEKREIHSLAFKQAWFKGFSNRAWAPTAYRQMALIPKSLVSRDKGLLLLRLYPRLELAFETPDLIILKNDQAIRLVFRHTDRGRIPRGWSLLV